jgi:hypothetical protein
VGQVPGHGVTQNSFGAAPVAIIVKVNDLARQDSFPGVDLLPQDP